MKHIVIGGAWPYANGSLHIGHIAALLPGDVLARYFRAKGDSVFYEISVSPLDTEVEARVTPAYGEIGAKIENGCIREALEEVFKLVRFGNRYYDAKQPWKTRTEAPAACRHTIYNCTWLIANLAILLHPFLPFSSGKIIAWLGLTPEWKPQAPTVTALPSGFSVLFARI